MADKIRILVVDDEQAVREMFEKFLARKGFDVVTAANALDGIRAQKRDSPDLVLTDYNMPEMNGIELLKELHLADPDLPVIMMSGQADMRTAADALREQAFDFLSKPIDSEELVKTIHRALDRKAVARRGPPPDVGKIQGPIYVSSPQGRLDISILTFNRPLDQYSLSVYSSALGRIESEHPPLRKMIFVLKNVSYINNIGLNLLLDTYKRWKGQNRKIVLAQLSDSVHQYLKMLGYLDFFPVTPSLSDAIDTLV